ncbi:MAG: chemotaxis protein CheW [Pseudomonadota bacterium]
MDKRAFEQLQRQAEEIRQRAAPVPLAHEYIEYWHGAAFEVLGLRCVASMKEARKVVDLTPTISIPGVKPWVRGLANIGGRVLAIADLSAFLSGNKVTSNGKQALVISGRGIHCGIIIDASFGGVRFPINDLRDEQGDVDALKPFISGVFTSENGDYAVFNIDRLLNHSDFMEAGVSSLN